MPPDEAGSPGAWVSRFERFEAVESTQAVVRQWLSEGETGVCVAVADQQTDGRGRLGRSWQALAGHALLVSIGFRPKDLAVGHGWRLPAIASMAMLDTATSLLGPTADRLALKWPNDIIAIHHGGLVKLAGVLAESVSQDARVDSAVVGIGINVDWPKADFPAAISNSMWSLSEATGGRRVDREALLLGWLERLEASYGALARGDFDADRWMAAQITTGAQVEVEQGHRVVRGIAVGLDAESGALLVRSDPGDALERIDHGDVVRCRLAEVSSDL